MLFIALKTLEESVKTRTKHPNHHNVSAKHKQKCATNVSQSKVIIVGIQHQHVVMAKYISYFNPIAFDCSFQMSVDFNDTMWSWTNVTHRFWCANQLEIVTIQLPAPELIKLKCIIRYIYSRFSKLAFKIHTHTHTVH